MACDLRTASERSRFGLPEIKLGMLPGLGGTQRAIRMLPVALATRMLLTGDPITAAEAHNVGFCEPPTPVGGALEAALALAGTLGSGPREAMSAAKELVRRGRELTFAEGLAMEQETGRRLFGSSDAAEGVGAFLEKRQAEFGAG
jgi:enoyl-CoA hydratase/carnithine racemase